MMLLASLLRNMEIYAQHMKQEKHGGANASQIQQIKYNISGSWGNIAHASLSNTREGQHMEFPAPVILKVSRINLFFFCNTMAPSQFGKYFLQSARWHANSEADAIILTLLVLCEPSVHTTASQSYINETTCKWNLVFDSWNTVNRFVFVLKLGLVTLDHF